jgi:hypothetical protein
MSSTIHGTGKRRRDDIYNRIVNLFLKGQTIPLGGFYNGNMATLITSSSRDFTEVQLTNPDSGLNLIICGVSKCGGTDVCG